MLKLNKSYFLIFIAAFFATLLVSDNKTFLILFFLVIITFFFFFKKNLFESVYLALIIALPFENNLRQWIFYSSPPNIPSGYFYFFGISPKIILGFFLFLLLLIPKYRLFLKKTKKTIASSFLIFFITGVLITSSFFQTRTSFIFVGFIRLWLSVWFYFATVIYFSQKNKTKILQSYLISLAIFSIFIGLNQFIAQKPLGKFIELTPFFFEKGYSTTDGIEQFRVSGFISHPVYFGSFLSIIIPIITSLLFIYQKNYKKFYFFFILLVSGIIVLVGTLSRSTWINLLLIFLCFLIYQKKHPILFPKINFLKKYQKTFLLIPLIAVSIPTIFVFAIRIKSVKFLFSSKTGNGSSRIELIEKSLNLIKYQPLSGVGLNNSTFELTQQGIPEGIAAPPHNTILIFCTELGIPTTIFFLLLLFFSLYTKKPFTMLSPFNFGCWVGLLTFLISSQFHPLFNLDPTFDFFMFLLGYFSTTWKT